MRFRALFEQAPVSIQILAPDGRTLRVNRAWESLWQIHEGTALKAHVLSAAYNVLEDPQLVDNGIADLLRRACAGESVTLPAMRYDVAALDGAGPARWVTARAHPITDDDGTILEVMLMHEDITERVEAENALRMREARFRSLVMATSQTVWTAAPDGRVIEDSPSWRAFTGQGCGEILGTGWLDAVHPDDRGPTAAGWAASVAARTVFETRYRIRRADGEYRWVAVKGVPILDADGAVREWIGANADIHDMVAAQAELAGRLDRERRNSALLTRVAQASHILHTGLSSRDIAEALVAEVRDILGVHQAAVCLADGDSRYAPMTVVSLSDKYAGFGACELATGGSAIHAEVCRSNRPMRLTQEQLAAQLDCGGLGGPAHPPMRGWLAAPLVERTGRNIGLIQASDKLHGEFTDDDEAILVQLAAVTANGFENARLFGALQEQDRRKDEFLAMLAHELRNPLAPISAAADLLRTVDPGEDRVRKASDVIARQVRHMTSLVDDLLDVSRVTRGLIKLDIAVVDVAAVVANAVEQARPLMTAREHAFAIEGDAGGIRVRGDANRLVQVVVNLLNNAAKYTPRGGRIALVVTTTGASVTIGVRDNGIGLDSALLPQVFDLFTQAERSPDRAQGGLGIGLALVRNIVAMHGGQVAAHSAGPGQGSLFTVTLETVDDDAGRAVP